MFAPWKPCQWLCSTAGITRVKGRSHILDSLYARNVNGISFNCRSHSSRRNLSLRSARGIIKSLARLPSRSVFSFAESSPAWIVLLFIRANGLDL